MSQSSPSDNDNDNHKHKHQSKKRKLNKNGQELERKREKKQQQDDEPKDQFESEFHQAENKQYFYHENPNTGVKTRLRGIVKIQEALFYPSYDYYTCVANDKQIKFKNTLMGVDTIQTDTFFMDVSKFEAAAKFSVFKYGGRSQEEGIMVDDHITAIIKRKTIHTKEEFPTDEDGFILTKQNKMKVSRTTWRRCHPLAQKFIKYMLQNDYVPLDAQVPVGDNELGICTAIDSVWRNTLTRGIALVETKKYNRNYYMLSNDTMRAPYHETELIDEKGNVVYHNRDTKQIVSKSDPFATPTMVQLTNSPLNQHQLQMAWGYKLWQTSLGEHKVSEVFTVQLDGGTPQRFDLRDWALDQDKWDKSLPRLKKLMDKQNAARAIKLEKEMEERERREREKEEREELKQRAIEQKQEGKRQTSEQKKRERDAEKEIKKAIKDREREVKKRQSELTKELKQQERKRAQEEKKEQKRKETEIRKRERQEQKAKEKAEKLAQKIREKAESLKSGSSSSLSSKAKGTKRKRNLDYDSD